MRKVAALVTTAALGLGLAACSSSPENTTQNAASEERPELETTGPETITDPDGSGLEVAQRFFESADTVVVSDRDYSNQLAAAEEAVATGAPMITSSGDNEEALSGEIDRLGASEVVTVGDIATPEESDAEVRELEEAESAEADGGTEEDPSHAETVTAITELTPGEDEHPVELPPVMVSEISSPAATATAKAAGGEVHLLPTADPRATSESMEIVTAGDTIALGAQFGSNEDYAERVDLAHHGELPGGGGLVFPGRRMIALYGHPSGPALGAMGEQPPAEAVARLENMIAQYQPMEEQPVVPAFEIIVTVASEFPGADGNYSNEGDPEQFIPYIDAITEAGGYAFLDLQPGQASFLEQAKLYEDLLKRPNVGLALDPEWNIRPGEQPMQRIGSAEAAEVNEVIDWLANLVQENDLPQKGLILHQFQMQMLRDREQIDTSRPELSYILHADGNGVPGQKFDTWNVMQQGLSDDYHMAWKNFIDEDSPMFSPEQTYEQVNPRPWFVSYQ